MPYDFWLKHGHLKLYQAIPWETGSGIAFRFQSPCVVALYKMIVGGTLELSFASSALCRQSPLTHFGVEEPSIRF